MKWFVGRLWRLRAVIEGESVVCLRSGESGEVFLLFQYGSEWSRESGQFRGGLDW